MHKIEEIAVQYAQIQSEICSKLAETDGEENFVVHPWKKDIGSGLTNVLQGGAAIEKGAVNFSFVKGDFTPKMESLLGEKANKYAATGISSIMHPVNPFVPIIHMNVRHFSLDNGTEWFGGGIDLTPHFINPAQAREFHLALKAVCDKYDVDYYPKFKSWADDYFYLPHREETRGVGGIFFDRVKPTKEVSFHKLLDFTSDLGRLYPVIYSKFIQDNRHKPFTEADKRWQQLRRGRYVEFNLIYDRGTKFGLESNGNTESILLSLPANASWEYNCVPEENSPEEVTQKVLKKGVDWINY